MENNKKIFIGVLIVVVLALVATAFFRESGVASKNIEPGKYDEFAKCLGDAGATFYGAFWCPHCKAQKELFGSSKNLLPYVECSTPDAQGQTQICIDKGVNSYPTWEFADGSRMNGEIPLEQLAEKTQCVLPQ